MSDSLPPRKFVFKELENETGYNQQPYLRVMMFFKKKPGVTDEFFHKWWRTIHADLAMTSQNLSVHLLRYSQIHQEKSLKEQLIAGQQKVLDFDGFAEFYVKNMDALYKWIGSGNNAQEFAEDGYKWSDYANIQVMAGHENLIFGSTIAGVGTNGIQNGDSRLNGQTPLKETRRIRKDSKL